MSDSDIDIDDEELIQMQYKQKGVHYPKKKIVNRIIHVQKPHVLNDSSLLCKITSKMSHFKRQIEYMHTLNQKNIDALKYYTDDGYEPINNYLRYGGDKYSHKIHNSIELIDGIFKSVPPLTENVIVYRGIKSSFMIDASFIEKSFVSTTVDTSIASEYANQKCCFFKIYIPKGTRVIPLVSCSENASELEVLLPRNSHFKFTSLAHDGTLNKNVISLFYGD